ncbi:MAG: tetratricopeptide repeat protein, partial [Dehalococcoidia bacterium]|nr:tetratricopeptide repeat protein [Dehalococcoidia bacterium]
DWEGADQEYQLALELDPGSCEVPYAYALFMSGMGRHDEAVALGTRAQELDPLNPSTRSSAAARLRLGRQYEESLEQSAMAMEMGPDSAGTYKNLGDTYEAMGRYVEAAAAWEKSLSLAGAVNRGVIGLSDAPTSAENYWRWWLDYFREKGRREFVSPVNWGEVYAQLGEKDQAFAQLEKAHQQHDGGLWSVNVDPVWDPIRDDPRFTDLLRRMNLAQ